MRFERESALVAFHHIASLLRHVPSRAKAEMKLQFIEASLPERAD